MKKSDIKKLFPQITDKMFPKEYKTENEQLEAVTQNGNAIYYIDNPSEVVQLAAINQYNCSIQFINKPSKEVQLTAVNKNGFAIRFIDNPTEAVQLAALNQDYTSISYFKPSFFDKEDISYEDKIIELDGKSIN